MVLQVNMSVHIYTIAFLVIMSDGYVMHVSMGRNLLLHTIMSIF